MKDLQESKLDKHSVRKLKTELAVLRTEHDKITKMVNFAKPAEMPSLLPSNNKGSDGKVLLTTECVKSKMLPLFGRRSKLKMQLPSRKDSRNEKIDIVDDEEREEENHPKSITSCSTSNIVSTKSHKDNSNSNDQ